MSETNLSNIYYIPKVYWKGLAAIQKLAEAGNVSEKVDRDWLRKQALWHVYLPVRRHIPRPKFHVPTLNKIHQAEFLFFCHTTLWVEGGTAKLTNMLQRPSTLPAATKKLKPLRLKRLQRLQAPFGEFTSLPWGRIHECCHQTYERKWNNYSLRSRGYPQDQPIVERFNSTLASVINTGPKCGFPPVKDQLHG